MLLYDCRMLLVCLGEIGGQRLSAGGQRRGEWDWLHHNSRYNKPLIWWSICSRTSSSIIHSPVRHHCGSGAVQEPDRLNSFPHVRLMTQRLCIHQPVYLCSPPLQMWLLALTSSQGFILLIKQKEVSWFVNWTTFSSLQTYVSSFVDISWLFTFLPACAFYQNVCNPIYKTVFSPIIWFGNYLNLVT